MMGHAFPSLEGSIFIVFMSWHRIFYHVSNNQENSEDVPRNLIFNLDNQFPLLFR